jgi:hypothetical protein
MNHLPLALAAAAMCAASLPAAAQNVPAAEARALRQLERQQLGIYRAFFPDLATGRKAAISLHDKVIEVDWKQGFLVLELESEDIDLLARFGFRVQPAPDVIQRRNDLFDRLDKSGLGVQSIPGYACYETVEETYAAAESIVASKPQLATWFDVGDSWKKTQAQGGYDLKVLKLTNSAVPGPKPKLFVNAAIHAREYATAPLVLSFARWLADGYGSNADATWILDHHEVHLLLQTNPDGRKKAEAGLSWRKNVNTAYCSGNSVGADLNRNFSYSWNVTGGTGSSGNPCAETYRGPTPSSEPETLGVENYVRSLWPDRRGPGLDDPAPADTSGIHLDIHSYGELLLWPWGVREAPAANGTALQTLGRRFAWFNGHTPEQSIGLYPTDGTTDGVSYGELGVAAFTFEIGTSFFQSCSSYTNDIQPKNLQALIYAAKVVRTPYLTPGGPDATGVTLPPAVPAGTPATLTAQVSDTRFNQTNGSEPIQTITGADAYIDVPPWAGGAVAIPLAASDGSFNSSTEAVTGSLPTAGLADGKHLVFVVARDASGATGPVSAGFLNIGTAPPPAITLALTKTPSGRRTQVNLAWAGAVGSRVDVYRNGVKFIATANDGAYSQLRPAGTWTYKVCQTGSAICSPEQAITTP